MSVVHPTHGMKLAGAVSKVSKSLDIGGHHYKRVPRGYDPDHPFAQFLLFNGLTASTEEPVPADLHSPDIVDHCFDVFSKMVPLHEWLRDMAARARAVTI